jgi:GTP cyclohydrolase I
MIPTMPDVTSHEVIEDFMAREVSPNFLSAEVICNTPQRFVNAFRELMGANDEGFEFTTFPSRNDEMVIVKDIDFVSLCEHHMLPFLGHAHVGYIPQGVVAGLSKIPRAVQRWSRGLWLQEDLTFAIADFFQTSLQPTGVAVVIEAQHTCMAIRGVKAVGTTTITSCMLGAFREKEAARAEFLGLIR